MTLPEALLWSDPRDYCLGDLRFRRQHPVRTFILEFYCAEAGLAVEVDVELHGDEKQAERESRRDT